MIGMDLMRDSPLMNKSKSFALEVIKACKVLREAKCEGALVNQFLRSGTSIGANIYESNYAQGKKDFISKLEIALKEASETGYWLELLHRTGYLDDPTFKSLGDQCSAIRVMLVASCRTAKQNMESN